MRLYLPDSTGPDNYEVIVIPIGYRDVWTFADFRAQIAKRFPEYQHCRLFFHDHRTDDRVLLFDHELVNILPQMLATKIQKLKIQNDLLSMFDAK